MNEELLQIPINQISTVSNYRKTFNEKSLKELAASIEENGVIEPIIVRRKDDKFELIAGERRLRASEMGGQVTIKAIVREVADEDLLKLQIVENIQREGVQFMEEARAIRKLRDDMSLDISEIAQMISKTETHIYNTLSLTKMSPAAQDAAEKGELGKEVAIYIARLKNPDNQTKAAMDLRRSDRSKLISGRTARKYIKETFGAKPDEQPKIKRNRIQKQHGSDYQANWKKYLVKFSAEEFLFFKESVNGRTETAALAEAVEWVMTSKQQSAEVANA